jgi:menaquinone-dependent protoporphyrinogen IX oxidase
MKVLVTWYSRTGHTRSVGESLARQLDGAAEPIVGTRSREGVSGYLRSLAESVAALPAAIAPPLHDPARFDLVVIGTPVWAWGLASPVRAFARAQAAAIRRTAFFCTMGGSGSDRAFDDLQRELGRSPVATLALTERDLADRTRLQARTAHFVAALRANHAHASTPG